MQLNSRGIYEDVSIYIIKIWFYLVSKKFIIFLEIKVTRFNIIQYKESSL